MGKNYFTPEQVEQLKKNKYVKHVSEKAITYTEEFKEVFITEYNSGKLPSQILIEMGFDYKALGQSRIDGIAKRIKVQSIRPEGFKDTRTTESGRSCTRGLTQEELIERQKMEMYYVEHNSLWLDIKILFKTVISVIKKEGAQ